MADVRVIVVERDELVRLLADAVRSAIASHASRDEWVDARTSGLGRRLFLRLAHQGAFPVSKRGKTYVARRSDVDVYLERQRVQPEATPCEPAVVPSTPSQPSAPSVTNDDPIERALASGRLRVLKKTE
jgi:hypothetical protein